jgi:radical SAM/Cys-rich protein
MSDRTELPVHDDDLRHEIASAEAGPRSTTSLRSRRSPLQSAARQIRLLDSLNLADQSFGGDFGRAVQESGRSPLSTSRVEILQINLGKLCNMTCRHCHVDAGPDRWQEVMDRPTVDACLRALDLTSAETVDITGGAPELNPHFRHLVQACVDRGVHVIDRCNLTVLLLPRNRDLPAWFAERGVEVVCSLPHHRQRNTDVQRGDGTHAKSIEALRRLNAAGYGSGDPRRVLTVVVNPVGAVLTGDQRSMERRWKESLEARHGVSFDRLIALNNMPIARFLEWLESSGNLESYMELLVNSFNPATVDGLMCRNTLSVAWDGTLYDCDFNQMLELPSRVDGHSPPHVSELTAEWLRGRAIVTGRHCFGCTAGAGSSCGGALDDTTSS